jgi:hypothetical protein
MVNIKQLNPNKNMNTLLKYSASLNIILTIVLIISLNTLPRRIKKAIENKNGIHDTVLVDKVRTADIQYKNEFIYFEGKIVGKLFLLSERYSYDVRYPEAIFDGYLTPAKSFNDAEYYIWSKYPVDEISKEIKAWFFSDGLSKFQSQTSKDKFYNILYPVVEKDL